MDNLEQHLKAAMAEQGKKLLLQEVNAAYANYAQAEAQGRSRMRIMYGLSAAAAIALILFAIGPFSQSSANSSGSAQLFAAHYVFPSGPALRAGQVPSSVWEQALNAYNNKNFDVAVSLFEQGLRQGSIDQRDAAYYYLGHAYLSQEQVAAALDAFEKVGQKSLLYPDARWFKALAYLSVNRVEEGVTTLRAIATDDTHHNQAKAQVLLKQLDRL